MHRSKAKIGKWKTFTFFLPLLKSLLIEDALHQWVVPITKKVDYRRDNFAHHYHRKFLITAITDYEDSSLQSCHKIIYVMITDQKHYSQIIEIPIRGLIEAHVRAK